MLKMLLSAVVKLIFFLFKKYSKISGSLFSKIWQKKNMPTFCNPTRNSLYISSVFTIKNVFKNGLYYDKVHISNIKAVGFEPTTLKSSLSAPCLVSPMLLNVYLNKSKKIEKKNCYRNNWRNKKRKAVHRTYYIIIRIARESILQLNLICEKQKT